MAETRPLLVFLIAEDWFFTSHFLVRGLAAQKAGWRVIVIARQNQGADEITKAGLEFIPVSFDRHRLNPFKELGFALHLAKLYRQLRPQVVHHIALKPIILGGVAARLAGLSAIINAPVGLGFVFASPKPLARLLRPLVTRALKITMSPPRSLAIFENPDDRDQMVDARIVKPAQTRLIRGAGVDMIRFAPSPEPPGPVRVLLAARMIREKGVLDFIEAARHLHGKATFLLAGAPDPANHNSLTEAELQELHEQGIVHWLGPVKDMPALLRSIHIFTLPSTYREGLPKVVLEAMAAARPVVATDIPGCREAVINEQTGLLVPTKAPQALANALERLITNPPLRVELGNAGRKRVAENFSDEIICQKTLEIYETYRH